jgi:hypothetical protein
MKANRNIIGILLLMVLLVGCQDTEERSATLTTTTSSLTVPTTAVPLQIFDDSDLNRGIPIKVVGTSRSNTGEALVKAKDDSSKKLWYITSNPWAVQAAEGSVAVNYTGAGKLVIETKMENISGSFGGYPSIIYGRSPWNKVLVSDQPAKFPVQIKQMQELSCLSDYTLNFIQISGNIAYDLWLTDTQFPDNPNGGVEIMVWLWRDNTAPLGSYVEESSKEIKINDISTSKTFKVYVEEQSAGRDWDVVTFVIDDPQAIKSGGVGINMLDFIEDALVQISRSEDLYLQDIEFGVEFTNQDQDFSLELNKFQIDQLCY